MRNLVRRFFTVYFNAQTYRNFVYELLALPLTFVYVLMIVLGFSLGTGLLVIGVGLFILMATTAGVLNATRLERRLLNGLLGMEITPIDLTPFQHGNWLDRLWRTLTHHNGLFWRSMVYFAGHLLFGILGFAAAVVSIVLTFGLLVTPFFYQSVSYEFFDITVTTLNQALLSSLLGFVAGLVLLNLNNLLVRGWMMFAGWLLSDMSEVQVAKRAERSVERLLAQEVDAQSYRDADKLRALIADDLAQRSEMTDR